MSTLESQVKDNEQKFSNLNKKIHDLEGNLNEKESLINKMQKKIARLNAVTRCFFLFENFLILIK